jgi:hypothetical protein
MDPLSAVVGAVTGAAVALAKEIASKAVSDAYDRLKNVIASRFRRKSAIEALEEAPDSPSARAGLEGALKESKAFKDREVLERASELAAALRTLDPSKLQKANLTIEDLESYRNILLKNLSSTGDLSIRRLTADGDIVIDQASAGAARKK